MSTTLLVPPRTAARAAALFVSSVSSSDALTGIELETSDRIAELHRTSGKPVVVHSLYGSLYADLRPAPLTLAAPYAVILPGMPPAPGSAPPVGPRADRSCALCPGAVLG